MQEKRKRLKVKATCILTSDLHLRDDQPTCRIDNYFEAQEKKLKFIKQLSKDNNNCPILCAGDLFHKAKSSKSLEIYLMKMIPKIYTIPGQHDLPNHNINKINESSIGILDTSESIKFRPNNLNTIYDFHLNKESFDRVFGIIHTFIQNPNDKQDKLIGGSSALSFLKKHREYDLILSGDNHKTFVVEHEGRLLVNPGSLMRMTAAQINHKPCIFLYYKDTNTVKQIFLPVEENVIDREHIVKEEEKEKRFESFIKQLNEDYEISFNFTNNLKKYFNKNKTSESIKNIIWEIVE